MSAATNNLQYFKLFACCLPVKGAMRSTICDIQRNDFSFIPNGLYDILMEHKLKTLGEIKNIFQNQYDETIDEYYQFLEAQEYGSWCEKEELEIFPALDLTWEEPHEITNAIIDQNNRSNHDYQSIINQLEELACNHIQIRFFEEVSYTKLEEILKLLENSRILSVELTYPENSLISLKELESLIQQYPRVNMVFIHSSENFEIAKNPPGQSANIVFITDKITGADHCGKINHKYFSINIKTFTEAQKHNTCLNRKISIDTEGNIKNCPSCNKNFGNIKVTKLNAAINKRGFKDLWYISKDQIEVCKDCEFRYICTDCRAYIQNPENIYSKPATCQYDPYTATGF